MACPTIPGAKFLGCSVVDFSASAGWGAQSSEVTINLVADCAEVFIQPLVGSAHTFKIGDENGDFSFTGLIQSWNTRAGSDGLLYTIKLISPHPILDNAQIILDNYQDDVKLKNIINVYAHLEFLTGNCGQNFYGNAVFGSMAHGFGGSRKTARGIPWPLIRHSLQDLVGGGESSNPVYCKGLELAGVQYILDISDIPLSDYNYRLIGPTMSLTDLINQVCEDAGCDYYIELLDPNMSNAAGMPVGIIKVVTITRQNVPALGAIYKFVNEDHNGQVISNAIGQELRSEVNNVLLIGGKVKQYYQCWNSNHMTPFWGWNTQGFLLKSFHTGQPNGWQVELDFRAINLTLSTPTGFTFGWVGENELRAAAGDYESFQAYILSGTEPSSVLLQYLRDSLSLSIPFDSKKWAPNAVQDAKINAPDNDNTGDPASSSIRDAKALHHWLNSYASQVYGKQFVAGFTIGTAVCISRDSETGEVIYSDEVSTDGGWASAGLLWQNASDILGIPNPSAQADRFKDLTGKVQPMVMFDGGQTQINTKGLSSDDYIVDGNRIWIKATVHDKWIWGTPLNPDGTASTILCALVTISNPVTNDEWTESSMSSCRPVDSFNPNGLLNVDPVVSYQGSDVGVGKYNVGGQSQMISALGDSYMTFPRAMGVPMKSNTTSYAPWWKAGVSAGTTQVEVDEGLTPWEYGGFNAMAAAGWAKVSNAWTQQQMLDRGAVTIPGTPSLSLAQNIDGGGVLTSRGRLVASVPGTNRTYSYYSYQSSTRNGAAIISNISTSAGEGGVTTTYTVNSFTPVFGRFSRQNAQRIKQIGLNRQRGERDLRASAALRNLLVASENRTNLANAASAAAEDISKGALAPKTPAITFVGKRTGHDSASHQRNLVVAPTKNDMVYYAKSEFQKTAAVTMDAIFRPVQSPGSNDGGLAKVNTNDNECFLTNNSQTTGPPPPIIDHKPLKITAKYLDFLTNPKDDGDFTSSTSWINSNTTDDGGRASSSTKGHDIEGVARGVAGNEWGGDAPGKLAMHSGGQTTDDGTVIHDYNDKYRFMALRGPLMIHGWGYDVNGKPIPNENDSAPDFQDNYEDLTDKFKDNWLENSDMWPVAPVDLRFDRHRGVWTTPPAFRLYQVAFTGGELPAGGSSIGDVINYKDDLPDDPKVEVHNWTKSDIESGAVALAYYDTAACEYWVIPPASGSSGAGMKVGTESCSGFDPLASMSCESTKCIVFGGGINGDWAKNDDDDPLVGETFVVTGPKIQSQGCSNLESGTSGQPKAAEHFDSLIIGAGLTMEVNNCVARIGGPKINKEGCNSLSSGSSGEPQEFQTFEKLTIGQGLKLEADGCLATITGPSIASDQPIPADASGCSGTGTYATGTGSYGFTGVCTPTVDNPQPFETLVFSSGLTVEYSECVATITASGGGGCTSGITSGIPFVSDVCCSGSHFIAIKQEFSFHNGCLTGVTEAGSCPTC